jgi:ketosteroid isomerase-like protein
MTPATAGAAMLWRYFGAVEAGDQRVLRSVVADDATWTLGPWAQPRPIVDVFLAAAMSLYEPGSVGLRIMSTSADGGEIVLRWAGRGRRHDAAEEEDFCFGVAVVRDAKIRSVAITPVARPG